MGLAQRVMRLVCQPSYVFGRFAIVRSSYAAGRALLEVGSGTHPLAEASGYYAGVTPTALADLRRDAFVMFPQLPAEACAEIKEFAEREELVGQSGLGKFRYRDVARGKLPDGRPVALGAVVDCGRCPPIVAVRDDPTLNTLVRRYLGYTPTRRDTRLYWSFASDMSDAERRGQNQTIDYHFDVHDYNFCYLHVYITDCDSRSGAHVLVRGSHRRKPVRWLFGSARRSDDAIRAVYPATDLLTLEGMAGTGFLEDTSCYHKALAPMDRDRLLLQVRYH